MVKNLDEHGKALLKAATPDFLMNSPITMAKHASCGDHCGPCNCFGAEGVHPIACSSAGAAGGVLGAATA